MEIWCTDSTSEGQVLILNTYSQQLSIRTQFSTFFTFEYICLPQESEKYLSNWPYKIEIEIEKYSFRVKSLVPKNFKVVINLTYATKTVTTLMPLLEKPCRWYAIVPGKCGYNLWRHFMKSQEKPILLNSTHHVTVYETRQARALPHPTPWPILSHKIVDPHWTEHQPPYM